MRNSNENQIINHHPVLEQNIRWHQTEAYFYSAIHPENFNLFEQRRLKRQVKKLSTENEPSMPVLDLASGTGHIADHLQQSGISPVACDLSLEMLRENQAEHKVRCDITNLPFKDGCFGAITAYSVFHHLPDPGQAMKEIARVAAKNCVLYFDHDHFLPATRKTLGYYPFTISDLVGWLLWLILRPKYLKRLAQYALWGRKLHLKNIGNLNSAESHDRVKTEELVKILENNGFRVQLVPHRAGSFLKAYRDGSKNDDKKRVVHIATGFVPVLAYGTRGPEKSIYFLTKYLSQLGCDIDIIDIKEGFHSRGETKARFYELWTPPLSGANLFSYFLKVIIFTLQLLPALHRLAKNGKMDIIHAHSQFPAAAILLARRLFGWKIPVVYTAHNPYLLMPPSLANKLKHLLIEDKVLRRVDRVVAQTEAVGRELNLRFNIELAKIRQVYAGIDIESINDFMEKHPCQGNSRKMVFYPAVINPRKNQMAIIQGIPQVLKACPGCRFVFAGTVDDKAYFNTIQRFVLDHGLSPWVEFTGELSPEPLYRLYRDATIFVFPTHYESQGVVLVEAMAFGLPAIASRIGPILDVVSLAEGSALIIDPDDTKEIAKTIIKLLQDEPFRSELSAKGRKLASSRFPWSRIGEETLVMYEELIRSKN